MVLETLPEELGYEIKQIAWRSAWMATNEAIGFYEDAAGDKQVSCALSLPAIQNFLHENCP